MNRRTFIAGVVGLLGVPLAGEAQQPGKVPRIGLLAPRNRSDGAPFIDAFLRGLRELGWIEGQNIAIEYRFADGRFDRLADLATELVRLKVDVILAASTPPAMAAKGATKTIPIVMATSADPVELGLVAALARPGGNVTGLSFSVGLDIVGKELELLKETVPKIRRVAVLSNPANPGNALAIKTVRKTAPPLGVQLQPLEARGSNEFEAAFAAMAREGAEALLVVPDSMFGLYRGRQHRGPVGDVSMECGPRVGAASAVLATATQGPHNTPPRGDRPVGFTSHGRSAPRCKRDW